MLATIPLRARRQARAVELDTVSPGTLAMTLALLGPSIPNDENDEIGFAPIMLIRPWYGVTEYRYGSIFRIAQ